MLLSFAILQCLLKKSSQRCSVENYLTKTNVKFNLKCRICLLHFGLFCLDRQFLSPPSNPALANQFLMDSLLTERALASYKMVCSHFKSNPRSTASNYNQNLSFRDSHDRLAPPKGQYPKPFIAPTFSL